MYSSHIESVRNAIINMNMTDKLKVLAILERKNSIIFDGELDEQILKHLYIMSLTESNDIIHRYIIPEITNVQRIRQFIIKFHKGMLKCIRQHCKFY